jgi:hypothetical protein
VDQELRGIHAARLQQKDEEEERDVTSVPKDLLSETIDIRLPSSILQDIKFPSVLHDLESSSETFDNVPAGTISSPTLSISTVSDWTSTELGEEIEYGEEQTTTCHDTFYFEDGNVEIVCGHTLFRVHSTIISFSSPKLRDILSPLALLHAQTPEGRPRITIPESAEDFGILLKMIYTPGWDSSSFALSSAD